MFITKKTSSEKRLSFTTDGTEHYFSDAAVMLAFSLYLLNDPKSNAVVTVHPDSEHAKNFDIADCLLSNGFTKQSATGETSYAGQYERGNQMLLVDPSCGHGNVVGKIDGKKIIAECKGGVINTTHSGQVSKLKMGLSELIGQLLILPEGTDRHIAVLPYTALTKQLAGRFFPRLTKVNVEIALVHDDGNVEYIHA